MKCLNFCLIIFFCLVTKCLFAQTPQQIEADLIKSFNRIGYWREKANDTTVNLDTSLNSLGSANDMLAEKLKKYAQKFPQIITYPFNSLDKYIDISTSTDGLFRIYSWDNQQGGTMRYFVDVFQYKSAEKTVTMINKPGPDGDSGPNYCKLYTFKTGNKAYYLVVTNVIGSTIIHVAGIQVFSIDNGKLNDDAKIIKTKTGLHSQINYEYDPTLTANENINAHIYFDAHTQSIYIPIVLENGKLTNNYILYKFTGQYFERVKN